MALEIFKPFSLPRIEVSFQNEESGVKELIG